MVRAYNAESVPKTPAKKHRGAWIDFVGVQMYLSRKNCRKFRFLPSNVHLFAWSSYCFQEPSVPFYFIREGQTLLGSWFSEKLNNFRQVIAIHARKI